MCVQVLYGGRIINKTLRGGGNLHHGKRPTCWGTSKLPNDLYLLTYRKWGSVVFPITFFCLGFPMKKQRGTARWKRVSGAANIFSTEFFFFLFVCVCILFLNFSVCVFSSSFSFIMCGCVCVFFFLFFINFFFFKVFFFFFFFLSLCVRECFFCPLFSTCVCVF